MKKNLKINGEKDKKCRSLIEMEPSFHDKIIASLNKITEDQVLIVGCNNINERSAVNRLAYYRGCSTKPINYDGRIENYIYCDENGYRYFAEMDWEHEDRDDYDYYNIHDNEGDQAETIIYYYNSRERHNDFIDDENIIGLNYNAVVIYPNYMKVEYKDNDEFLLRKRQVTRRGIRRIKGKEIKTDEKERKVINKIYDPIIKCTKLDKVLIRK